MLPPNHKPIGPLCKNPYINKQSGLPHGCGQCQPCTIKNRRIWSSRIMLESYKHAKSAFVTLTYDDEIKFMTGASFAPEDPRNFLKKLRKKHSVRYYYCAEYGDENQRPHYHFALFGLGPEDTETIHKAWSFGDIHVGDLTKDSAQYVASYVTKKMNHPESKCTPKCKHPPLAGRLPEYSRMSLKPGIGALCIPDLADTLTTPHGCDTLADVGDVPHHLILERKQIPLGKYLRGKLREKLGFPEKNTPKHVVDEWRSQMQELQKDFKCTSRTKAFSKFIDETQYFKEWLIDKNKQKVLQIETKNKIYGTKIKKL